MRLEVQESENKQEILLVDERSSALSKSLKQELKKYDTHIYISPRIPVNIERFDHVFVINPRIDEIPRSKSLKQKIIALVVQNKKKAQQILSHIQKNNLHNVKVIFLESEYLEESDYEKLLWFSFSKSREVFFRLNARGKIQTSKARIGLSSLRTTNFFTKKRVVLFLVGLFFFFHLAFYPLFLLSGFFVYKSGSSFRTGDLVSAKRYLFAAENSDSLGNSTYALSRPTYLFFGLALFPDTLVDINDRAINTLDKSFVSLENSNQILTLIFKRDKSNEEKSLLEVRLERLKKNVDDIKNNLVFLDQKLADLPFNMGKKYRSDLTKNIELISKVDDVLPYTDTLLAKGNEIKYLLLFANNMELRPGGGFIGSFGVLTMRDFTLEDLKIYDVYDADGQLLIHVDPPEPIRKYLNQPNWFLRDSAFSPDFFDNYSQAKFFLDQELKLTGFSGGMLITTTAIQNILGAYDSLYLPDFNEQVTKDNFYLKAQFYSEKNFFPGSTQKKNFLGAVADQIIINADIVSPIKLVQGLKKSLDEKQLAILVDDPDLQTVFDNLYWSGKTIEPRCVVQNTNCIIDYIFPMDANLGVNKANFFVTKLVTQRVTIDRQGQVKNSLLVKVKNDSPNDIFPGGAYRNYFQVLLPKGALVTSVEQDGAPVSGYDEVEVEFKNIGMFIQVPPKSSTEIKVTYDLPGILSTGKNIYQLIFQKQIGSSNSDFVLEVSLPDNISLSNQNFSPLVKEGRIFYNTSLSADKIFFLELVKR